MLKHILAACALALSVCLISACGGSSDTGGSPAGQMKVGLLVTGSTADRGWNQLAADSLNALAKTNNLEVTPRQNVKKDDAADAIRQMESKGYSLVILHGYEYLDVAKGLTDPKNASPVKIKIAVSGGDSTSEHFQSVLYDLAPASYQLGILAAKTSKTGKIGFIGGAAIPTVTAMEKGYEAGAKSVNPAVTVTAVYTDNWDNPAIAKSRAEGLISQGNDVIMQNVDAASSGVFEAVKENNGKASNQAKLVFTFGANSDQNDNAACSNFTLASAVIKMDACFRRVVSEVKAGTFKGGLVKEDIANGHAVAVLNPKLTGSVISAETQKLVEEAGKKLASGEIKIPQ